MTLESLIQYRNLYRDMFRADLAKTGAIEQVIPDRALELTGHAFVVKKGGRVFQVSVKGNSVPSAYIKQLDNQDKERLLQVVVSSEKSVDQIDIKTLFREWIVADAPEASIRKYLSRL